jgi:hypothetical protein
MKSSESFPTDAMPQVSPVFEETYAHYASKIADLDLPSRASRLGARVTADRLVISLFNREYVAGPQGITGPSGQRPSFDTCIVLFKYILLCPDGKPAGSDWASFRDLKDSGPLTKYFAQEVEHLIAGHFAGRKAALISASQTLGGKPPDVNLSYDVSMRFEPLSRVPLLLLFNDQDEEFPAHCAVLFEQRAEAYLDAECLAILGGMLASQLRRNDAGAGT